MKSALGGALSGSLGLGMVAGPWAEARAGEMPCCSGEDPLECLSSHRFDVLSAFFEAQLCCLWDGPPGDRGCDVAVDAVDYMRYLTPRYQEGLCGILSWLNIYSLAHARRRFPRLSVEQRCCLLNQGESPLGGRFLRRWPMICWDNDYPLHAAVSSLALLGRLVISSRRPAREYIGCTWSTTCQDPENLIHIGAPDYPNLDHEYDVCVIGSGAGGAVIAARAAAAGKRVLMIETGKWVSPDALVERELDASGQLVTAPPRGDRVLKELYRNAGVQLSGNLGQMVDNPLLLLLPSQRRQVPPQQSILVLQPQVVGGGPYVNNAIHLEVQQEAWERWPIRPTAALAYDDLWQRMQDIKSELGVNILATERSAGLRGLRFADGAKLAGDPALPTPVSIPEDCEPCGADNSVDPFGMHTGGLHPYRTEGPNSFLMQALKAEVPADVAYETTATAFEFETRTDGAVAVRQLLVEDRRGQPPGAGGAPKCVRAKQFVLSAGVGASTRLLQTSLCNQGLAVSGLGEGLNGNVGAAVIAVYDQPIYDGESERPEPGITQCFFVREREVQDPDGTLHKEPVLENWFHFPGTVALALTGWFHEYAKVMRKYNHIASAGMVVPTGVRPENRVTPDGKLAIELNDSEFELLVRGMLRIGRIFLAATSPDNGLTLYLPTKAVMLDDCGQPIQIRNEEQLRVALDEIRRRGPAFLNLVTSHPQGGNALGTVVDETSFRLKLADGGQVQNLYLADASIFPAGCEVNPQLTLTALASYAADSMLSHAAQA